MASTMYTMHWTRVWLEADGIRTRDADVFLDKVWFTR